MLAAALASLASIGLAIAAGTPPSGGAKDAVEASVSTALPTLEVESYFASGPFQGVQRLVARGDTRGAVAQLKRLLKQHPEAPDAPQARYVLGVSLMRLGAYEEAARLFGELAESYPILRDDHLFLRGQALYGWGNYLDAAEALALVDPEGPRGVEAMRLRAFALLKATAFDRVVAWLGEVEKRAQSLDPELTFVLARARHRTGDVLGAYRAFRDVFREAPGGALAGPALVELSELSIGDAPMLSDRERAAVRAFRERLLSGKNVDRVMRDLETKLGRGSSSKNLRAEIAYVRGRMADAAGQLGVAKGHYVRATELAPVNASDLRARIGLSAARVIERLGEQARALAFYRAVVDRFPDRPESEHALYRAAEILLTSRRYAEAEAAMNTLLLKNPVTPYRPRCIWGIGWARYRRGEFPRAREFFASLTKMSLPADVDAASRYWLARTEAQLGDSAAAKTAFVSVLERHPLSHYAALAVSELGGAYVEPPVGPEPPTASVPAEEPRELQRVREYVRLGLRPRAVEALAAYEGTLPRGRSKDQALLRTVLQLYEDLGQSAAAERLRGVLTREFPPSLQDGVYVASQRRLHPMKFEQPIRAAAAEFKIADPLLFALVRTESSFQSSITSNMNAFGLTQLLLPTAQEVASRIRAGHVNRARLLHEPALNVRLGAAYLRSLIDRYQGSEALALAAYNAGPTAVDRWVAARARPAGNKAKGIKPAADELSEEIPVEETRNFVKNVLSRARGYARLYPQAASLAETQPAPRRGGGARSDRRGERGAFGVASRQD